MWRALSGDGLTLTQPPPQPASDLVNGVKVCHVKDVGILWIRCNLLQLLLQRLPDAHSEHPDASSGSCLRGLQNIILASAICEKDGHPLDASGFGPRSAMFREDVGGGVADGIPSHCISSKVAYVTGSLFYLCQASVSCQVEFSSRSVTVANHSYSGLIWCHIERLHKVGHPLPDLFKVLFSNTGWRIQDKCQVIMNIFTPCNRQIES